MNKNIPRGKRSGRSATESGEWGWRNKRIDENAAKKDPRFRGVTPLKFCCVLGVRRGSVT